MTADEDRRSSRDDEPPVDDGASTPPPTPSTAAADDESTTDEAESTDRTESESREGESESRDAESTDREGESESREGESESRDAESTDRVESATEAGGSGPDIEGDGGTGSTAADGTGTAAAGERTAPDPVPGTRSDESLWRRLLTARSGPLFFVREVGTSVGAVVLVGLVLFGISGVWPPMVAVESGSMEPHMHRGDLVFITEPGRFTPAAAEGPTGVVTAATGSDVGYRTFGGPGSVVVYDDPGRGGPPIIHRAEFYVEDGENWFDRANPEYVSAESCRELRNCPAPHAGFITKGDANGRYDQVSGIAEPVKPEWITGIARVRIPYLGWVRLGLADVVRTGPVAAGEVGPVLTGDGRSTADAGVAATRTGPVVGSVDHGPGGESVATGESGTALGTVTSEGVAAREWVRPVTSAPDEANATRPGRTAGSPGAASDGVAG